MNCTISRGKEEVFEKYLFEHEQYLISKFIKYMKDYAKFREKEMESKYKFRILREVKVGIQ